MAHNYEEKRGFSRMQVNTPLTFNLKSEPDISYQGTSHDLSATGLLMSSQFAPKEGAEIEVFIDTNNDKFPPMSAEGTILRVVPEQKHYQISVQLTSIK